MWFSVISCADNILFFFFFFLSLREKEYDKALQAEGGKEERKKKTMKEYIRKESDYLRFKRVKLGPNVFQTLKVIGKGAFGEVRSHLRFLSSTRVYNNIYEIGPLGPED